MFGSTEKRKILVIDDNEVVLEVTRAVLENAGHRVVTHDRAAGCVALVLQEKPDLVLMDVNMPRLGGDTIVSVLSKAHATREMVILLYSSLSFDVLRAKAEAAGAHGFIQKTGDQYALVRDVNRWLKRGSDSSSGRLRAAAEETLNASSGHMKAALRVGPDSTADVERHAALASLSALDEEARSSGTRAVAPALELAETAAASASAGLGARRLMVLLVDRDMAVLSTYRGYLQSDSLTVEYALSGSAALRRILGNSPPDVAVCDAFMPDVPGLELYRRALVGALSWRQRMILTMEPQLPSAARAFSEFKGQILSKPISSDALRSAVRACLALGGAANAARVAASR